MAVAGAGVVGLSTALLALEAGHPVAVYSSLPWTGTTSTKAAASFKPHEVVYNALTHRMMALSWERFARIARDLPFEGHGVRLHTHWEAFSADPGLPPYAELVNDFLPVVGAGVPGGYAYGWRYETFFIDTTVYLPWLAGELARRGGELVVLPAPLRNLAELAALPGEAVFNCTGLGAGAICDDPLVHPVKGQVVVGDPVPGMDWSISADGFYVYPRRSDTVIGGTAERDVWTEQVDPGAMDLLIRGNRRILPGLDATRIHRSYAGLRPYREGSIRVERQQVDGTPVVHNYGHGGAGVTLSWGSAELALALLG